MSTNDLILYHEAMQSAAAPPATTPRRFRALLGVGLCVPAALGVGVVLAKLAGLL